MTKVVNNIVELVGNTPLVKSNLLSTDSSNVYLKLEFYNPASSVKDRIALSMIESAEKAGALKAGDEIVEATSGNTGIGLAFIGAAKGYKVTLTMPESMSIERRKLLKAYGANLVLTPKELGMKGAIAKAEELGKEAGKFMPRQFENEANPEVHYRTTGPELWQQTDGKITALIAGVGTGGTVSGAGKYLKEQNSSVKVVAVEPTESPVLSGGEPGPHKIQGIGAGFVPNTLDVKIYDEVIKVDFADAVKTARALAREEGVLVGISSGAVAFVAQQYAKQHPNQNVVAIAASNGERYLTTALFEDE